MGFLFLFHLGGSMGDLEGGDAWCCGYDGIRGVYKCFLWVGVGCRVMRIELRFYISLFALIFAVCNVMDEVAGDL
jgi:hypothetical protein